MRKSNPLIISLLISFFLISCKKEIEVPVWTNKSEKIVFQNLEFIINSKDSLDRAILYTPVKTIALDISQKAENLFHLTLPIVSGIVEGSSLLFIKTKNNETVFEFDLINDAETISRKKDYRSPKTVNPDSVLVHQQMVHYIDQNRNLVAKDKKSFFTERMVGVSSKSGQYEGITDEPLTNYYSQPGTAASLPLSISNKGLEKIIKVGPVVDKYGNKISDGTLVYIRYSQNGFTHMIPVVTRDGIAITTLNDAKGVSEIFAETAKLTSKKYSR